MPNTETSFADRLARAGTMQSKIEGFAPAFALADPFLGSGNFSDFLASLQDANLAVATAAGEETAAVTARQNLLATLKGRTTRVVNFVGSNESWAPYLPAVKQAADKVRNFRPSKKAVPPPAAGTPAPKKRMTGQQSYGDIDGFFEKLIEAVKLVPGYGPTTGSLIRLNDRIDLQTSYRAANKTMATKSATMTKAERNRKGLYDNPTGSLRSKMKAIKKATSGQYGRNSSQYSEISSIQL